MDFIVFGIKHKSWLYRSKTLTSWVEKGI